MSDEGETQVELCKALCLVAIRQFFDVLCNQNGVEFARQYDLAVVVMHRESGENSMMTMVPHAPLLRMLRSYIKNIEKGGMEPFARLSALMNDPPESGLN